MIALLFSTLRSAEVEAQGWIARKSAAHRPSILSDGDIESVTFVLPFSLSPRIQDVIGFQWPAFFITSAFVPVPSLYYGQGRPVPLEIRSYLALTAMVGLYWFAIATWLDKRIVQRTHISSLRWVRVLMGIASIPSVALLLGFYSKMLFTVDGRRVLKVLMDLQHGWAWYRGSWWSKRAGFDHSEQSDSHATGLMTTDF
jgi:hypothetical protein